MRPMPRRACAGCVYIARTRAGSRAGFEHARFATRRVIAAEQGRAPAPAAASHDLVGHTVHDREVRRIGDQLRVDPHHRERRRDLRIRQKSALQLRDRFGHQRAQRRHIFRAREPVRQHARTVARRRAIRAARCAHAVAVAAAVRPRPVSRRRGYAAERRGARIDRLRARRRRAGYTRYWVAEHHNMASIAASAPEVMIAAVAAATSRIRVGAGGS